MSAEVTGFLIVIYILCNVFYSFAMFVLVADDYDIKNIHVLLGIILLPAGLVVLFLSLIFKLLFCFDDFMNDNDTANKVKKWLFSDFKKVGK